MSKATNKNSLLAKRSTRRSSRRRSKASTGIKKGVAPKVQCWAEADATLAELGRLEFHLEKIERTRSAEIERVEAKAAGARHELEAQREQLVAALEKFCRQRGQELERLNGRSRRSRQLLFGRVGYRASQGVLVRSETGALRALAGWRAGQQFLRTRTELDREALRRYLTHATTGNGRGRLLAGRLRQAGIELERRDSWFYELDRRAVERWG